MSATTPETLRELLGRRSRARTPALDLTAWLERTRELFTKVREWMSEYEQLRVEDWSVLFIDEGKEVNAPALAIGRHPGAARPLRGAAVLPEDACFVDDRGLA